MKKCGGTVPRDQRSERIGCFVRDAEIPGWYDALRCSPPPGLLEIADGEDSRSRRQRNRYLNSMSLRYISGLPEYSPTDV